MVKKLTSILLFISLKLYSSENFDARSYFTRHVLSQIQKKQIPSAHSEESIIAEFKGILKDGEIPTSSISEWLKHRVHILLESPKTPVKNAGVLLHKVHSGEILSINGAQAVPTIIEAVKAHHEDFNLTWFESGRALIKGTKLFFSGGNNNEK